ncbi:MFS transporter [Streptomyces aidingensis]
MSDSHAAETGAAARRSEGAAPAAPGNGRGPLWLVVLAACVGQFLVVLDVAVVNVALPSVQAELGMNAAGLQWVVNAYSLTFAGFLLLGGRAGDIFGRKRVFLLGLGVFTAASLAGGLAQQPWQLITARAVQGIGAATLAPATLSLLTTSVPEGPARHRAIGTWTAVGAGGGAAGGVVSGILTDTFSWRWVLLVNVPVGGLALIGAALWLVESRRTGDGRRLDMTGALLVTAGLSAVAYGIVQSESAAWTAPATLAPLLGGALLLTLFVLAEARSRAPLMPLRLFRLRSVSTANTAMFVCGAAMVSSWYFLTLYMQNVLGLSPLQAGLGFVPHSTTIVLGAKLAPRLMVRAGARGLAMTGALLAAAGYFWQSAAMDADGGYPTTVLAPGITMMLGAGLLATPLASLATSGVPAGDAGIVAGLVNTARTMGGALGLAVLSTVAAARIGDTRGAEALAEGYATAFRTGSVVLTLCAALMFLTLPRGPLPHH